ncbi:hypothetical protein ACIG3E_18105 [Streptomyces sp. NPDC053474]|uniref:hypothetical protein n=1 Tax=Streptomyces sp. NPDC053474 TaxID=3365704 RepID=UPI0037D2B7B4
MTHFLLSTGRYETAAQLVGDAAGFLEPGLSEATPSFLSVYGTLFLAGAMAAARAEDRATTQAFLREAEATATRLGTEANHMSTAFGPPTSPSTRWPRPGNSGTVSSSPTAAHRSIRAACLSSAGYATTSQ